MIQYQGFGGIDGVVAGSKHMFSSGSPGNVEKILHDCGGEMEGEETNKLTLPFDVKDIRAVVLSHGHFDHMGDVHKLYINGYRGNYFGHEATMELTRLQMQDLAMREFNKYKKYNESVRGKRDRKGNLIPFKVGQFQFKDTKIMNESFLGINYGSRIKISRDANITLFDAGHIIGASQVLYEFNDAGRKVKLLTCVDLGRMDFESPILNKPWTDFPDDIDYCMIESTYGNRLHTDIRESRYELEEVIARAMKENKRILVGAFSTMRTQLIMSDLFQMYKNGRLGNLKIYFDSPSALRVNSIILNHSECMDERALADFQDRKENPFRFPNLEIITDKSRSIELDNLKGPYMIVSASGMWSMGRIVGHLKSHIEDKNAILVQTGYQVPGCIGFRIEEGKEKNPLISIEGKKYKYLAEQVRIRGYSAHADGRECVRHMQKVKPRKKVFIVHGEKPQQDWLSMQLDNYGFKNEIVRKGKIYSLE